MANNILIIPASASIQFSGSAANTIRLVVEDSGSVAFYGDSGSLFGISDSLSGSLMSVNDISGFPILEVTSDDTVTMGTWNQNTLVVTGSLVGIRNSTPTHELSVTGDISASGDVTASAFIGDGSQVTGVVSSSYALTASYAANGGGGGGGVTINNNTDNYLVTATGTADTLDGESNLTFNGNDLGVSGSLLMHATASGANDMITMTSGSTQGIIRVGDGNFQLDAGSQALRLTRSNSTIIQDGSSFRTISSLDLGTDGQRWGRLYITDVSASGEVSASSFIGDGSQVTGVVTSSYSNTASYVETAQTASYFIGDISFPSGLEVTGSLLLDGSMSASGDVTASAFTGDGSNITGVVSSSHALDADNAISASYALTASYAANGGGGGGVTINNNTDNYLVTATGTADTLDGESNLTFNGNDLGVSGSLVMHATASGANDMITLTSGSQQGIIRIGNGNFEFKGTSSGLRFEANNGTEVFYNGLQFTSNNEHQLGNNGSRWGRLYVTDVSSSGEVSASSFIGDGSNITGVVSSSHAVTADSASYVDGLISFPNGLDVTGSLLVDGDISASGDVTASNAYLSNLLTLQSIDPLPTTPSVTGSIAVSSSGATEKLYFHDGSAWKEVSFV